MKPIAHIENDFKEKFGIPRQSGLAPSVTSVIVFDKKYRNPDALRGLEEFSHIWLIWGFSANKEVPPAPTVRPPRLGGNTRKGVFATRSPYRPNPIGLSSVKVEAIHLESPRGPLILVSGADLMNKTPIYDIKPYIYGDCHPEATSGFAEKAKEHRLTVQIPESLRAMIQPYTATSLIEILSLDPRPSYQDDETRIYGITFGQLNVKFKVANNVLKVCEIEKTL